MRVALDTSVLVAAVLREHAEHERSIAWLGPSSGLEPVAAWHAVAECWATLGRVPVEPRLTAAAVARIVDRLRSRLELALPTADAYDEALRRCERRGMASAVIYDALHLVTAREVGARALVTLNVRDFQRVWENGDPEIVEPPSPPGVPAALLSD